MNSQSSCELPTIDQKSEQRAVKDEKIILIQMFLFFVLFLVIALVRNASHTLHHTKKNRLRWFDFFFIRQEHFTQQLLLTMNNGTIFIQWNCVVSKKYSYHPKNYMALENLYIRAKKSNCSAANSAQIAIAPFFSAMHFFVISYPSPLLPFLFKLSIVI